MLFQALCYVALELAQPDSHHRRIIGVKLQATIRLISVPQALRFPDSVIIRTLLGRKNLHSHAR